MKFCKSDNQNPVKEFLDALPSKDAQKISWVLRLVEESDWLPVQYFFQEEEDRELWEIRITVDFKNYWLLAFAYQDDWVLCNADFSTTTQKAFQNEKAEARKVAKNYKPPFWFLSQNDLHKYIKKRKKQNDGFDKNFEEGYLHFKIGAILRQARQEAKLTQAEIADKLGLSSTVISRVENHAEELSLDLLQDYVHTWSKKLNNVLTA
ncbi:MAG: helix-turn-helix transcriptional regulator [Balneolaceae bacterium]